MNRLQLFLLTLFVASLTSIAQAAENTPEALKSQIQTMNQELDTTEPAEIKKFVIKYLPPDVLAKIQTEVPLDEVVQAFMKSRHVVLKGALKYAEKQIPSVSGNGLIYTFDLEKAEIPGLTRKNIKFQYSPTEERFHLHN